MSFLSILLVASAFYFAQARPDSQSWDIPPEPKPAAPEEPTQPIMDPSNYQHQLFGLMEDMSKAVEQYMSPLMLKFDEKKQDLLKAMCMNGLASHVYYVLLLIQENEKYNREDITRESSQPRHEMIIHSDYSPSEMDPNKPFMTDKHYEEEEEEDEQ